MTETVTLTETAPATTTAPAGRDVTETVTVTTTTGVSPAGAAAAAAAASDDDEGLTSTEWGWVLFGLLAAAVVIGAIVCGCAALRCEGDAERRLRPISLRARRRELEALDHDDRDVAVRAGCVRVVVRPDLGHLPPEPLALVALGGPRPAAEPIALHLQLDLRLP